MSADRSGRIFISYRRQETAWPARQLYEVLVGRFGAASVFKDVDDIEPGDDFVDRITEAVAACDVLLALIGPQWLTMLDDKGRRRLDNPDDFVRLELKAALSRGVRVVPILVDGARMPPADQLPDDLVGITRRQAVEINPVGFNTERLLATLANAFARTPGDRGAVPPRADEGSRPAPASASVVHWDSRVGPAEPVAPPPDPPQDAPSAPTAQPTLDGPGPASEADRSPVTDSAAGTEGQRAASPSADSATSSAETEESGDVGDEPVVPAGRAEEAGGAEARTSPQAQEAPSAPVRSGPAKVGTAGVGTPSGGVPGLGSAGVSVPADAGTDAGGQGSRPGGGVPGLGSAGVSMQADAGTGAGGPGSRPGSGVPGFGSAGVSMPADAGTEASGPGSRPGSGVPGFGSAGVSMPVNARTGAGGPGSRPGSGVPGLGSAGVSMPADARTGAGGPGSRPSSGTPGVPTTQLGGSSPEPPGRRVLVLAGAAILVLALVGVLLVWRPWTGVLATGGPTNIAGPSPAVTTSTASPPASPAETPIVPVDLPGPPILAHRGGLEVHQFETQQAMEAAARAGFAVETDVRYTSDGVAVLVHDERATKGLDCGGTDIRVSKTSWSKLRATCRSKPTAADSKTYEVPTLDATLEAIAAASPDAWVFLEVKTDQTAAQRKGFLAAPAKYGLSDRTVITSSQAAWLRAVRDADDSFRRMLFVSGKPVPVAQLKGQDLWGVAVEQGIAKRDYVQKLKAAGLKVMVWVVNDPKQWGTVSATGPDLLMTAYPAKYQTWLAER